MDTPDHFGLFGLPERFSIDLADLEKRYLDLSRQMHPDRHATGTSQERLHAVQRTTDLNDAYKVLRDDFKRAEHLLRCRGIEISEQSSPDNRATVDHEVLMEVLELREALAEAREKKDLTRVQILATDVRARSDRAWTSIKTNFEAVDSGDNFPLRRIAAEMNQLRYYRRFLDEVDAIEESI